jgi:hypothetical protein
MSLGRDFSALTLARFTGRLQSATLTRPAESAYDDTDPTAAPTGSGTDYDCEGLAFTYERRDVDGVRIMKSDFQVVILRGSLSIIPDTGDMISIPPPGESSAVSARVVNVDAVTEAFLTLQCRGPVS